MNTNLQSIKQLTLFSLVTLLLSCGGGDKGVPDAATPTPEGTISGVIMLGAVRDAEIEVYAFDATDGNKLIVDKPIYQDNTRTATGRSGLFSFALKEEKQFTPIMICAVAGNYNEPAATLKTVRPNKDFNPGDKLCAVTVYERGKSQFVSITPFTHLATGLLQDTISEELLDIVTPNPTDASQPGTIKFGRISSVNTEVGSWLGDVDILKDQPQDFTSSSAAANNLSDPKYRYGLAILSISRLVDYLSTKTTPNTFENASSIEYTQRLYDDISDGFLDGKSNGTQLLFVGDQINLHLIRHHYALSILSAIADKDINHTGLELDVVKPFARSISQFKGGIFPQNAKPDAFDLEKPVMIHPIANVEGLTVLLNNNVTIEYSILDAAGLKSVVLELFKDEPLTAGAVAIPVIPPKTYDSIDGLVYKWSIDTTLPSIKDGLYVAKVTAISNSGGADFKYIRNLRVLNGKIGAVILLPNRADPTTPNKFGAVTYDRTSLNPTAKFMQFTVRVTDAFPNTIVKFRLLDGQGTTEISPMTLKNNAGTVQANGDVIFESQLDLSTAANRKYVFEANVQSNVVGGGVKAGTFFIATRAFAVDTGSPTATITSPLTDNEVFNVAPILGGAVGDLPLTVNNIPGTFASDIEYTEIWYDKVLTISPILGKSISQPLTNLQQGFTSVELKTFDTAKNVIRSNTRIIGYDTVKPVLVQSGPAGGYSGKWWPALPLGATAQDKETGLATFTYSIAGGTAEPIAFRGNPTTTVSTPTTTIPLTNAVYNVLYQAIDLGNNEATLKVSNLGIDNQAPTLSNVIKPTTVRGLESGFKYPTSTYIGIYSPLINVISTTPVTVQYSVNVDVNEVGRDVTSSVTLMKGSQSGLDVAAVGVSIPATLKNSVGDDSKLKLDITGTYDARKYLPIQKLSASYKIDRSYSAVARCTAPSVLVAVAGVLKCAAVPVVPPAPTIPLAPPCTKGNGTTITANYIGCSTTNAIYTYTGGSVAITKNRDVIATASAPQILDATPIPFVSVTAKDKAETTNVMNSKVCINSTFTSRDVTTPAGGTPSPNTRLTRVPKGTTTTLNALLLKRKTPAAGQQLTLPDFQNNAIVDDVIKVKADFPIPNNGVGVLNANCTLVTTCADTTAPNPVRAACTNQTISCASSSTASLPYTPRDQYFIIDIQPRAAVVTGTGNAKTYTCK